MHEFYDICLKKEHLQNKVAVFGLVQEKLTEFMQKVIELENSDTAKLLAKMESERSTFERNKTIRDLMDEWYTYKDVLIVCYGSSDPQFLEGYGIPVPTGGFRRGRKKKNDDTKPGEDNTTNTDTDTGTGNETNEEKDATKDDKETNALETVEIAETKGKSNESKVK